MSVARRNRVPYGRLIPVPSLRTPSLEGRESAADHETRVLLQGLGGVRCACGWHGVLRQLVNPPSMGTVGGKPDPDNPDGTLVLGPQFPGCPRCKTDDHLRREPLL